MEKFALLDILKVLGALSQKKTEDTGADGDLQPTRPASEATHEAAAQKTEQTAAYPNVMASVIERHEALSNRIKNRK